MRLIDADALMEQTELICTRYEVRWTDNRVMAWIDNAPTVDAVPIEEHQRLCHEFYMQGKFEGKVEAEQSAAKVVHGRLIETGWDEEYACYGTCSVCGADNRMRNNFCGNCGAKMDGGENDE